jgi:hypothetical protein
MFHLAGIPSYLVVAELAVNRVLRGTLPRPSSYPPALRGAAAGEWRATARLTLAYARAHHAPHGRLAEVAGAVATAAAQAGHAVLAARGEWVTNEKSLLTRAGLRGVDGVVAGLDASPEALTAAVDAAGALFEEAFEEVPAAGRQAPTLSLTCAIDGLGRAEPSGKSTVGTSWLPLLTFSTKAAASGSCSMFTSVYAIPSRSIWPLSRRQ